MHGTLSNRLFGAVAAAILAISGGALAQSITLNTLDGNMTITGELQSFDGGMIVIRTSVGEVTVPASLVECIGEACPDLGFGDEGVVISGAATIGRSLMPALILGLADVLDADVEQSPSEDGAAAMLRVLDFDGEELAGAEIATEGSAAGFEALLNSRAGLGMSSRPITDQEAQKFSAAGLGEMRDRGREHVLALDALTIIVAEDNPIEELSMAEIAGIFSGRITNWRDVGGADTPISVHAPRDEDGRIEMLGDLAPAAVRHDGDEAVSAAIESDVGAIGVIGMGDADGARVIGIRTECGSIATPDLFSLKAEEYPLTRRLYLYTNGQPLSSWGRDVLDFSISAEAQSIIEDVAFIDQRVAVQPKDRFGARLALAIADEAVEFAIGELRAFVVATQDADRLSTTLRFRPGGSELDSKALGDIPRLVDYLAQQDLRGREVLLIGFTNAAGRASANRALSLNRAQQALEIVREMAPPGALNGVEFRALGFGETAPTSCNATPEGQAANRRIEVWIRDKS